MNEVTNVPQQPAVDGRGDSTDAYFERMQAMQEWAMKFQLAVNTSQTRFAAIQDANKAISYGGR